MRVLVDCGEYEFAILCGQWGRYLLRQHCGTVDIVDLFGGYKHVGLTLHDINEILPHLERFAETGELREAEKEEYDAENRKEQGTEVSVSANQEPHCSGSDQVGAEE